MDRKENNEEIITTANDKRKNMYTIRRREAEVLGHVTKKRKQKHLVTTREIAGNICRGWQIIKILDTWAGMPDLGKNIKHCHKTLLHVENGGSWSPTPATGTTHDADDYSSLSEHNASVNDLRW